MTEMEPDVVAFLMEHCPSAMQDFEAAECFSMKDLYDLSEQDVTQLF